MRYRVLPYRTGSRSAKALADALSGKVLKLEGSTFKPKKDDVVINWGNRNQSVGSTLTLWDPTQNGFNIINPFLVICTAADKLKFFQLMQEKCPDVIPSFWTDRNSIPDDAFPVVCRTVLCGHSGAGVVIAPDRDALVEAPLYTKYIKKKDEYRVHCGLGLSGTPVVISLQRKARRLGHDNPNWQVRNHQNGFVYVRDGVSPPTTVTENAIAAFVASGLDFGAVDVIYNDKQEKAYVLEINTAPGLEGQTVEDYAAFFKGLNDVSTIS